MKGFTLIEILVVVSLLAVLSALAVPFVSSFQSSSDLYTYADALSKLVRSASHRAMVGERSAGWGIFFNQAERTTVLYAGDSYLARNPDFDQESEYLNQFEVTTDFGDEIHFQQLSGTPSVFGTITVSNPLTGEEQRIIVGPEGLIQLQL